MPHSRLLCVFSSNAFKLPLPNVREKIVLPLIRLQHPPLQPALDLTALQRKLPWMLTMRRIQMPMVKISKMNSMNLMTKISRKGTSLPKPLPPRMTIKSTRIPSLLPRVKSTRIPNPLPRLEVKRRKRMRRKMRKRIRSIRIPSLLPSSPRLQLLPRPLPRPQLLPRLLLLPRPQLPPRPLQRPQPRPLLQPLPLQVKASTLRRM
ncbi:hypothetical protein BDEG_24767 [Batrachochytrium dendrobatidis JEL423]|uniref:Uncharacterized protein n=1 Tax=Batrachochytrium dendrobatidis (strain JEL423) TaxID=403673 RepID=A0A177WM04_BATDL|nr:hypothetical protein BDEG_24767 [Batrachochytrium dendrobatidis JEL423]